MALSIREQLIAAVATRLAAVAPPNMPGTITVFRGRRDPVEEHELPALVLLAGQDSGAEQLSAAHEQRVLNVSIEGQAAAESDEALDQAIEDFRAATILAVMTDPTWGGLAVDTNETGSDDQAGELEGSAPAGSFQVGIAITFWTRPGDPYTIGP